MSLLRSGGLAMVSWVLTTSLASAQPPAEKPVSAAQAELERAPLTITGKDGTKHVFSVELAKTPRQQEVGEMFRTTLPADRGMLFLWAQPQNTEMWMRNTLVPLDIVFIDEQGRVQAIAENAVPRSDAHVGGHGDAAATLELQGGVTEKLGIVVGDQVTSPALPSHGH